MSALGDPPENWLGRTLRYFAYFVFGVLAGAFPAIIAVVVASKDRASKDIPWSIAIEIALGSGVFFCLVGILTKGRLLGALLQLLGKKIDRNSWL